MFLGILDVVLSNLSWHKQNEKKISPSPQKKNKIKWRKQMQQNRKQTSSAIFIFGMIEVGRNSCVYVLVSKRIQLKPCMLSLIFQLQNMANIWFSVCFSPYFSACSSHLVHVFRIFFLNVASRFQLIFVGTQFECGFRGERRLSCGCL